MGRLAKHSVDFKARIVLGVLRGEMSMAEAARRHRVSETSIGKWKDEFIRAGREALSPRPPDRQAPTRRSARRSTSWPGRWARRMHGSRPTPI